MHVVQHHERTVGLCTVGGGEPQRLMAEHIRSRNIAVMHTDTLMRKHLLRVDAVAVGGAGFQSDKFHGVYAVFALYAYVRVEMTLTLPCVEVGTVVSGAVSTHPTLTRLVVHTMVASVSVMFCR